MAIRTLVAICLAGVSISTAATPAQQSGLIWGTVYDSVSRRALANASVQLVNLANPAAGRSATTDSSGSFEFAEVNAGRYLVGFVHPSLDSLGLEPPKRQLEVAEGQSYEVNLGIPGASSLAGALCGVDVGRDSTGLFLGRVRHTERGFVADADVTVSWMELRFTRRGLQNATASQRGKSAEDGMFAICGVPLATPLLVRAWSGRDSTGLIEVTLPESGLLRLNLLIAQAATTVAAQTNDRVVMREGMTPTMRRDTTAVIRTSRGGGSVRGVVRLLNGAPLGEVQVSVWGTGLETSTDANGGFALDSVPEGSQTLVARSLGLTPWQSVIEVEAGNPSVQEITLAPFVAALDTMRVVARRPTDSWRSGFDARRRRAVGDFIDEEEIARRKPLQVSDILRDVPGIEVLTTGAFGRRVMMRGRAAGMFCVPAVYVDGMRFFTGSSRPGRSDDEMQAYQGAADLEYVVNPLDVKAVEIYAHDSSIPAEFDDPRDGCGSIVIWTGARRR